MPATPALQPRRAALLMLVSVALFALMDAGLKTLSAHYPPFQVAAMRGLSSLPLVLGWALASAGAGALLRVRWPLHLVRGVLGIVMMASFVYALKRLPLSTAYSIFFVAPLLITALSVPILGEHVGPRRWTAIGIGMLGVVVVLRPGVDGLVSLPGLMVLLAATAYAIAAVTVSLLTRTDTPQSMVVWFLAIMAVGAGLAAIPGWVPLRWEHAALILGMGLAGAFGQIALTSAFMRGDASMIAPLEYTGLVWVIAWDWLLWQTLPDAATWTGAAIIVASGLYLLRREKVHVEAEHP